MKKIYSILIFAVFLFASCSEEFLERKSLTSLADNTFWTSEDDVQMALTACYSSLQSVHLYNSYQWGGGVVRQDFMSDNGWCRWAWMGGGSISMGTHSSGDLRLGLTWNDYYASIARCNRVIDKINTLSEDVISAEDAKQVIAEAKFIRALAYNLITISFTDAPLVTNTRTLEDADLPKSTKAEIVNFILTDLKDCVEDLPDPKADAWGRATKGAGYALLARLNLYDENWTEAADWAQKVIDLGYTLYPDFHGLFQSANEINDEVIFPVRFQRGADEDGAKFAGYGGVNLKNYEEVLPNLAEDYFCNDGKPITESDLYDPEQPSANRDPRFDASIVSDSSLWRGSYIDTYTKTWTGYAQRKYTEEGNSENHFDANEDFYVFRLGEILLIKAEALAESGGSSDEIFALINQLRDRVQMPHVDQAEVDAYFGSSIVEMVRHERRIETAFEGLRYADLKRWGILKERAFDFYMDHEKANNNKLKDRHWLGDKHLKWPIPQAEVDANLLLEQHSGW